MTSGISGNLFVLPFIRADIKENTADPHCCTAGREITSNRVFSSQNTVMR